MVIKSILLPFRVCLQMLLITKFNYYIITMFAIRKTLILNEFVH